MNQRIKAILFDLDGTLLDSPEGIIKSFFHVFDKHLPNHTFVREDVIRKLGQPLGEMMLDYSKDEDLSRIMVKDYREFNEKMIPDFPLYQNTIETLNELKKRGFLLGIVTSKAAPAANISIAVHKLDRLCDVILTSDDTEKHKPDPTPLIVAAKKLAIKPDELIYVGDAVHDIACAKAAGSLSAAATWGPNQKEDLLKLNPDYVLEKISDILKI